MMSGCELSLAKNVRELGRALWGLLFLGCLLFLPATTAAETTGYHEALLQLGYNPQLKQLDEKKGRQLIGQLLGYSRVLSSDRVLSPELQAIRDDFRGRLASLDLQNLYDNLPYSEETSSLRGLGAQGWIAGGRYHLVANPPGFILPQVSPPLSESSCVLPKNLPKKFGDFCMQALANPTQGSDWFDLHTETVIETGDLPVANFVRVAEGVLQAVGTTLANQQLPFTQRDGDELARQFSRDLPAVSQLAGRYLYMQPTNPLPERGPGGTSQFAARIGIHLEELELDFPEIGKWLAILPMIEHYQGTLVDASGLPLAKVVASGKEAILDLHLHLKDGRLLPLSSDDGLAWQLTALEPRALKFYYSVHLNVMGLRIVLEQVPASLHFHYTENGIMYQTQMTEMPGKIRVEGRLFSLFPVWLIDLMVPAKLEMMIGELFHALTMGNRGHGAIVTIISQTADDGQGRLIMRNTSTMPANGTLSFFLGLQRHFYQKNQQLAAEVEQLREAFRNALAKDLHLPLPTDNNDFFFPIVPKHPIQ